MCVTWQIDAYWVALQSESGSISKTNKWKRIQKQHTTNETSHSNNIANFSVHHFPSLSRTLTHTQCTFFIVDWVAFNLVCFHLLWVRVTLTHPYSIFVVISMMAFYPSLSLHYISSHFCLVLKSITLAASVCWLKARQIYKKHRKSFHSAGHSPPFAMHLLR